MRLVLLVLLSAFTLTACETGQNFPQFGFDWRGALSRLMGDMDEKQVFVGDPVFIRIFKEEHVLELWMKGERNSEYTLVKSYPICNWSGVLGPKIREGDYQSPEGFYETNMANLNPNSQYHIAFNIQYPNAFDRAHGRTGSYIMVHGDCVSKGCYAMTDRQIEEIYTLVDRALDGGQKNVPVHIFPFRMTTERMLHEVASPSFEFWMNIKEGYDYFETYKQPPMWGVQNKTYVFY